MVGPLASVLVRIMLPSVVDDAFSATVAALLSAEGSTTDMPAIDVSPPEVAADVVAPLPWAFWMAAYSICAACASLVCPY